MMHNLTRPQIHILIKQYVQFAIILFNFNRRRRKKDKTYIDIELHTCGSE